MSAPVDVLAVLDSGRQIWPGSEMEQLNWRELRKARVAVSELIDFAQRVEARISALAIVGIGLDNNMQTMLAEARAAIAKATQP